MNTKIKASENNLAKVFSSDYQFIIPPYQRPYAWTVEETSELFEDLFNTSKSNEKEETYFLGSIVLVKDDLKPVSEVIDGQQRLTTLTILLSVLRYKLKENNSDFISDYLIEKGKELEDIPSQPRLKIRKRENDFFKKYIQEGKLDELFSLTEKDLKTEPMQHIVENARKLEECVRMNLPNDDDVITFAKFLIQRCYLVVVSTPDTWSAYRIFSILNTRGLSLLPVDVLKSEIIGALPEDERSSYTAKWESTEDDLTRDKFNDLFGYIRMIFLKSKPRRTLQEDFKKSILGDTTAENARNFLDKELFPYADAFDVILNKNYSSVDDSSQVNYLLGWLNRIDNTDWVPVAMSYLKNCSPDTQTLYVFFKKLERLAAFMRTLSWDVNRRINRYAQILHEIEDGKLKKEFNDSSLELLEDEKRDFLTQLGSDVYTMTAKKRNYLIFRLDSFVSDGAASYNPEVFSIEHVLPQTMNDDSNWAKNWTIEQHDQWLHKIGNLVPLTIRTNISAQNYDFDEKKEKYFKSANKGTSSFALTTQVLNANSWTPEVVEKRQNFLLDVFASKENWDL